MQACVECFGRRAIPRGVVLFFCSHCSAGLSGIGRTNCLVCYECNTVYEIEIKMTELSRCNANAILRKYALTAGSSEGSIEESTEDNGPSRSVSSGEEELCSK